MATENTVVAVKITAEAEGAKNSVKSFKTQLKEATAELVNMSEKFGVTSNEAAAAARKVAGLKDAIGDAKALADTFNPDKKFVALGGALQGAVGGFSALQGAMGLFGSEGKEVEKVMLKVQSAMALQQGISAIMGAKDSFDLMKDGAIKAFQAIRAGIGSTGIGLFVLALGAIVAYWDDIKGAVSGVSEEQKKLNENIDKSLTKHKESLSAISAQEETLKRQGLSERDILNLKIKEAELTIIDGQNKVLIAEQTKKSQIEATERNKEILAGVLRGVSAPLTLLLQGIDLAGKAFGQNFGLADKLFKGISNLVFDPEATKKKADETIAAEKKGLIEMQAQLDGFKNQRDAIDKTEADKIAAEQKKKYEDDLKKYNDYLEGKKKIDAIFAQAKADLEKIANDEMEARGKESADLEARAKDENERYKAAVFARDLKDKKDAQDAAAKFAKENATIEEKWALITAQQKLDIVANSLNAIADIVGKNSATGKAIAIATSLINTYQGITAGVKLGFPLAIPAVLAAASTGFAAVKNIVNTKIPGERGGSSAPTTTPSMPSAPLTPQAQSTRLDQGSINAIGQASARSYVLESDITSHQERIQRLQRAARIN